MTNEFLRETLIAIPSVVFGVLWCNAEYQNFRLRDMIREFAPFIEIKKLQDGQDAFLAGLKPEEQVAFIQTEQPIEVYSCSVHGRKWSNNCKECDSLSNRQFYDR